MAGPDLPPAVQRFIADMDQYDSALEAAMALVDAFAERNDEAAVTAREALASAAEAADRAAAAYEALQQIIEDYRNGLAGTAAVQEAVSESLSRTAEAAAQAGGALLAAESATRGAGEASAGLATDALAAAAGLDAMGDAALSAAAKTDAATAATGGGGRRGGIFGILGATIGGIAVWHVALDLLVEGLISIGTAALAATVGLAAMYPAATNIYDRLTSMYVVTHALGQNLLPLHGQFDALAHAMAPQVVEAFGGALNLVSGQAGVLGQTAHQVVNIIDTWIAKIDIWANAQNGLGGILHTGVGYLQQFGSILGKVGLAIGNILRDDPGIARYLLDLVGGFATLLDWVTRLPGPILTLVLGLHGLYLWTRVFGGVLGSLGTNLAGFAKGLAGVIGPMLGVTSASGNMAKSFLGLSAVSWAWVGVVAVALAAIAYESTQADSATKKFISGIDASVSAMSPAQVIYGGFAASINQIHAAMSGVGAQVNSEWGTLGHTAASVGDDFQAMAAHQMSALGDLAHGNLLGAATEAAKSFWAAIVPGAGKSIQAQNDIAAYRGEIVKLTSDQSNLFREVGVLMRGTTSFNTVVGDGTGKLRMLGTTVKETTTGAFTFQQSLALMGLAGVKASDSFAVMQQKVNNLIDGYKALGIQGGILANSVNAVTFNTELQDSKVQQLNQGWDTFFNTVSGGAQGFVTFAKYLAGMATDAKAAGASITGLNGPSITLRNDFLTTAAAANTQMDNLTSLSAAAGLGARGTSLLGQANKDLLAEMLPAAKGSEQMTTILYALAQRGGYQGADSFKALSQWVGNTQDPMKNLDSITTTLTKDAGNLTTDVRNLAGALNQDLNQAMAAAILQADGGQTAFDNYANALAHNKIQSDAVTSSGVKLARQLITVYGNTKQAHAEFDTMTIAMGHTKAQADRLWASIMKVVNSENKVHNRYFTITGRGTGVYSISTNAGTEALLHHQSSGPGISGKLHTVAAGGIMRGGIPGQDSIHALLMPGEGVLTTKAVRMVGEHTVHALNRMADSGAMHSLHRMASGGIAGDGIPQLGKMPGQFQNQMTADMIMSMERSMTAAERAAAAAAAAAGGGMLHPTGSGGSVEALMRSMAASIGWTGGLWTDLYNVEMREAGFQLGARNPSSGAYGLAQFINGPSEYAQYGGNAGTAAGQITAMFNYIRQRYGNPAGAWQHELQYGWYDKGGMLPPGLSLAANGTGRPEPVGDVGEIVVPVTVMLDGQVLFKAVQKYGRRYSRRNSVAGPSSGAKAFAAG